MAATTDSIAPGSRIHLKVVKAPTRIAAAKTLVRLLSKDADAQEEDARLRRIRRKGYNPGRRGGRLYAGHVVKQHPLKGAVGESGTITATCDVLRDLAGVERFVEITAAE